MPSKGKNGLNLTDSAEVSKVPRAGILSSCAIPQIKDEH